MALKIPDNVYLATYEGSLGFGLFSESKVYVKRSDAVRRCRRHLDDAKFAIKVQHRPAYGTAQVFAPRGFDTSTDSIIWTVVYEDSIGKNAFVGPPKETTQP